MNIITGEKFQNICNHHISKNEHKPFELQVDDHIDVDTFDFTDFDNDELVYVNSSLLNTTKPKLIESKLYDKLSEFRNPFRLILHNSDDEFGEKQLKYLDIPNCKKIYTQNMNVKHPSVKPLPIGIANSCWRWGNSKIMDKVIKEGYYDIKPLFIYANFTLTKEDEDWRNLVPNSELWEQITSARYKRRSDCYDALLDNKITMNKSTKDYKSYLQELKQYKFCISPEGNGIDCYRTWEALYMRTIPICKRSVMVEEFAKTFPIYIIDDWKDLSINDLKKQYDTFSWDNWNQLDFETYCRKVGL
jgi:hypothetical protein